MTIGRRAVLGVLAAPAIIAAAAAPEFIWKFGHTSPSTHPLNVRLKDAAAKIEQQSGGRMVLQVFPDGQLGGDNDLLSQTRAGALQFCQPTGQILASLLPVTAINALGFVFANYDHVWEAMDGALGAYVRQQIIAKTELYPMTRMWNLGFREITTSTKPIRTAADLPGLKLRTPVAPSLVSLFRALGASPLALQLPEVYSALQTHIADGEENPLNLIAAMRFNEVQKFCSMTNHVWDGYWFCANARAWKGLPADLQAIVARNLDDGALLERADTIALDASLRGTLARQGLIFNDTEPASFREGLVRAGFYVEWRKRLGEEAWGLLERYTGALG